jgi:hypothetical protein
VAANECGQAVKFSGFKNPLFFLMVKIKKPSASTLGLIAKILVIIKLIIAIIQSLLT